MSNHLKFRQRGFAIADALIAFGVIIIAGVALFALQSNLMNGSRSTKAHAEALVIARDRTEVWRNYIEKDQYLSSLSEVQQDEEVDGVNATYTVSYTFFQDNDDDPPVLEEIDDTANPPSVGKTQKLTVRVTWNGVELDSDENPVEENVTLTTELYYTKPEITSAVGAQHDDSDSDPPNIPSPWITGVEGADETTVPLTKEADSSNLLATVTDEHRVMILVDDGSGGTNISFDNQDVDIIYYVDHETGRSNVEVVHGVIQDPAYPDDSSKTIPHVRLTSFGGGVNKISGEIIMHPGAKTSLTDVGNHLQLLASPPSYCVFPICADAVDGQTTACTKDGAGENGAEYVSYVCYVPADCTHGGVDCDLSGTVETLSGDDDRNTDIGFKPPPDRDLNGGWYGRVGNFNIFLDKKDDMVCVADTEIGGPNPNLTPSREYATHRWELDGAVKSITGNEGFNRSIECQSFIIAVKKTGPEACVDIAKSYADFTVPVPALTKLFLPPENMIRWLGESGAIPADDSESAPDIFANVVRPSVDGTGAEISTVTNEVLPPFTMYCGPKPLL